MLPLFEMPSLSQSVDIFTQQFSNLPPSLLLPLFVFLTIIMSLLMIIANITNIHHAMRSSEEIRSINAILHNRVSAMEASVDGIFILDDAFEVSYMNSCFRNLLNLNKDQASACLHKPWLDLFSTELRDNDLLNADKALRNGENWNGEYSIYKDGDEKYIELSLRYLPDGGVLATNTDVTARKDEEIERDELKSQFYQSQKMEAIGRLAGGVAHDFNNILAAINGYTEFLIEDLEDRPSEQGFAKKIMAATEQARKLVDQILTFSRRNDTFAQRINIVDVLQENISMISASTPPSLDIFMPDQSQPIYIEGNLTQISQTIMNLCVNAIDAMEEGSGVLRLNISNISAQKLLDLGFQRSTRQDDEMSMAKIEARDKHAILSLGYVDMDKSYSCITVSDTGLGMSVELMERAFEPFFTTKPVDKGTGLGLSTVQGVIAQHKGLMNVDSVVGLGTRFDLYFPIIEENEEEIVYIDETLSAQDLRHKKTQRILLVEDQQNVREVVLNSLQRLGYQVDIATDGAQAVDILADEKTAPFDLVLSDHAMPKMTGLELVEHCKAAHPDLPFILMSGYSKEKLQEALEEFDSIKAVLRKPVGRDELKKQLSVALFDE